MSNCKFEFKCQTQISRLFLDKDAPNLRWGMVENPISSLSGSNGDDMDSIIEIDEEKLTKYLDGDIGRKLFKVNKQFHVPVNRRLFQVVLSIAELNIPAHLIILLILICFLSRDGVLMENQVMCYTHDYCK